MSKAIRTTRITVPDIRARKGGEPIVCLTSISTQTSKLLDPHCDLLLVGDSLGMVFYGMDSTVGVTLEMMIAHGAAVTRGSERACIMVDLPFGSYQESPQQAFRNAARVMAETRCSGIKLEGGVEMAETIAFLTKRGIPVLGHVGLTPQYHNSIGGFRAQGRSDADAARVLADAEAVAEAGAFAVVVEATMEPLAREITKRVPIPTIGIGASPECDGQILVTEDVIGLFSDFTPRFVKRYADVGAVIAEAVESYAADVRARRFPTSEHCFGVATGSGGGKKGTEKKRA
jgi:3-methyl-2-oxobutanoate hydroxymethyltransferase